VILRNHGLLTVGETVDEAAWWFITNPRRVGPLLRPKVIRRRQRQRVSKLVRTLRAGFNASRCLLASFEKNPNCSNSGHAGPCNWLHWRELPLRLDRFRADGVLTSPILLAELALQNLAGASLWQSIKKLDRMRALVMAES
jgi:Class II Aldolase and Adducin N-terminal domain